MKTLSYISIVLLLFALELFNSCGPSNPSNNSNDTTKVFSKGLTALPKPINRNYGHGKYQRVVIELNDGKILAAGGYAYDETSHTFDILPTELFDTTTKQWKQLAKLSVGTQNMDKMFLLPDGKVFFKYGWTASNSSLEYGQFYFSIFDPSNQKWTMKYNPLLMSDKVPIQDCCLMKDGKVFIATSKFYYTWDPVADKYSSTTDMIGNREFLRCALLENGEVIVCGGMKPVYKKASDYCFLYPSGKTSKMLSGKMHFDLIAIGNNAYILTFGNNESNGSLNESPYQAYNYETNAWTPIYMPLASDGSAISQGTVIFPSNKGFILTEPQGFSNPFCMFDFNTFQNEPNRIFEYSIAPLARNKASLIRLKSGKIFILGYDRYNKLDECFIYDSRVDYPY